MFRLSTLLLILSGTLAAGGCGPRLSTEDLGTVEYRIPQVPGSETPYPQNQLKEQPMVD